MTFCSAVSFGKDCMIWKVRVSPRRQIASGDSPVMRSPLKTTSPEVGRWKPEISEKVVVLPAPFGPISADDAARLDLEIHAARRRAGRRRSWSGRRPRAGSRRGSFAARDAARASAHVRAIRNSP